MTTIWKSLPPIRQTDSATAVAAAGDRIMLGNAAGLFRRQGKAAWQRVNLAATEIQAIAFGEKPSFVAAGAGDAVEISEDGGNTWKRAELESPGRVTALSVKGSRLLAGTDKDGVFVSTNKGTSWRRSGLDGQMILAVCGDTLVGAESGLWYDERRLNSKRAVSIDAAPAWKKANIEDVVTAIASGKEAVVAGTEEHGLYRSTDGGATWKHCDGVSEGINAVVSDGARFAAATSTGKVYLSEDQGVVWKEQPALPSAVMCIALGAEGVVAGCYRAGVFQADGTGWTAINEGIESTNAIDLLWGPDGLVFVALDGLRKLSKNAWVDLDAKAAGDVRAATFAGGTLVVATDQGVFSDGKKLSDIANATLVRMAKNGDMAVLTDEALHLKHGGKWRQIKRSASERTLEVLFSPSYPEDQGLLLVTLRQGTRTSVVHYPPDSEEVSRLFDYDARSRWISIALPDDYKVNVNRPASFFAGTGISLFRPAWPNDSWQRDIIHDPNAIVLSLALSPQFKEDQTVAVGTTNGAVITRNRGLLWTSFDEGLEDRRALKMVFAPDGELYCLTPSKIYAVRL